VRIKHGAGERFSLEKIQNVGSYATLEELIEGCGAKLNLRKACPNRKYEYAIWEHTQDDMQALETALMHDRDNMLSSSGGAAAMEMSGSGEFNP
jgi:hypothetical protein